MKLNYIFFGTPKFAAIVLKKLINSEFIPEAVVCNPDEPIGRNQVPTFPPVKAEIIDYKSKIGKKIEIFQPQRLKNNEEFLRRFSNLNPDLAIVAAYGKIIPKTLLSASRFGFINIHPSLLPKYRGPSPIQQAILNGDKETGATIMKIDEEMDHGNVIANIKIQVSKLDSYESLNQKLAICGAELMIKTMPDYVAGKIKLIEQNHKEATYTKIIKKEDGKIDWSKGAGEIERMIRAFYPWPAAWTRVSLKSKILNLKIMEAEISEENRHQAGQVFLAKNNRLAVKCGNGSLVIKKLQLEGGKILSADEFLNGHKNFIGANLVI